MVLLDTLEESVLELRKIWNSVSSIVVLTGAGASAASGIPTYRGAGGIWTKYDPEKYASIDYFRKDPTYYWNFFRDERYTALVSAHPNPVHFSLAELDKEGKIKALITQNIDGLHQRGGSRNVIELHGNSRRFSCESCDGVYDFEQVRSLVNKNIPPLCPSCDQKSLRPDVVLFGESLSEEILRKSFENAASCELVIVVGSSLVVQPAASIPLVALQQGAKLVIINIDKTPLDSVAQYIIRVPADKVLPALVEQNR